MQAYIVRRLLLIVPTMLIVSLIVFLSMRLIPGDVLDYMVSLRYMSAGAMEALREQLGLNLPAHVQYARWISGVFQGDFGETLLTNLAVEEVILERLPRSLELGALSLVFALAIALPVGIYSGLKPESAGDQILRSVAIAFICIPSFWLGTMILVLPAVWWRWSPPMYWVSFWENPLGNLAMFIIPAIVLGMWLSGVTMRLTRTMMLEVLRQDYIRTAWAKGLRERAVVLRHALKNALNPVLTTIGLQLAGPDRRRGRGGTHIQHTRYRLAGGENAGAARLSPAGGTEYDDGGIRVARERHRRHQLRLARPADPVQVSARKGSLRDLLPRLFREKKLGAVGLIIVLVFFLVGVFADVLATHDLRDQNLRRALEGPSAEFPLGTDQFGRDLLTRVIHGARVSMIVGVGAVAIGLVIALFFGLLSGYWGGTFDLIVQRFVDAWLTFPWLFIVLTVMSLLGQGMVPMIVVLGAFTGIGNVRTVRGVVLSTKQNPYVEAARAVGCPTWRILLNHVPAAGVAAHYRGLYHLPGCGDSERVDHQLPRLRDSATTAELGRDAEPRGPPVHGAGAVAGDLARACPSPSWCTASTCSATRCATCSTPRLTGGAGRIGAANVKQAAERAPPAPPTASNDGWSARSRSKRVHDEQAELLGSPF